MAHKRINSGRSHASAYTRTQTKDLVKKAIKAQKKGTAKAALGRELQQTLSGTASKASTKLGTAHAQPSKSPITWGKYAAEHGASYTQPVSGIVEADKRAAELIAKSVSVEPEVVEVLVGESQQVLNEGQQVAEKAAKGLSKGGKYALIAAGIAIAGIATAAIVHLVRKNKAEENTHQSEVVESNISAVVSSPEQEEPQVTTPVLVDEDEISAAESATVEEIVDEEQPHSNIYEVKKGDCIWNIAKQILIEENEGKIPSDKEILSLTREIINDNRKEFENDGYTVVLLPGEKLDISKEHLNLAA